MEGNSAYHGVDDDEARIKQSDDLNNLIVQSYQLDCYHVALAHTPLSKLPMASTLNQNDDAKQSWLRSVDAVGPRGPHTPYYSTIVARKTI